MSARRFQVQYGQFPGEKGYVVVDTKSEPNYLKKGRVFVLTTHTKGEAVDLADQLNAEGEE